jgi:hypothetical protein
MLPINIENFEQSIKALDEALLLPRDEIVRDASICRFRYCLKLSYLQINIFLDKVFDRAEEELLERLKNAAKVGLINDVVTWKNFRQKYQFQNIEEDFNLQYAQANIFILYVKNLELKFNEINNKIKLTL